MNSPDFSPEERKRFYTELKQNEAYRKNRKMLISTTVMAAVFLLVVGVMTINNLLPMWMVLLDLVLISVFYMYFSFRAVRRQNEITEYFRSIWGKKPKSKEKRR